jgi:hypothetical protein
MRGSKAVARSYNTDKECSAFRIVELMKLSPSQPRSPVILPTTAVALQRWLIKRYITRMSSHSVCRVYSFLQRSSITNTSIATDGGGVRGLSSLLILDRLMNNINTNIQAQLGHGARTVHPQDIFTLIAGTSTGGLIAIMLGKLGMTVQESIRAYHELSEEIFGRRHIRGRMTLGLGPTRYSGTRLRDTVIKLIRGRGLQADHPIVHGHEADHTGRRTAWYENNRESKSPSLTHSPVPLFAENTPRCQSSPS